MFTRQYHFSHLERHDLDEDPFKQFDHWFQEAAKSQSDFADAMTLATTDASGAPDARIVLLKDVSSDGFVFFTSYDSVKARQLEVHPHAAAVFWWSGLERQVRVRGAIQKVSAIQSDAYFKTRPRGSQLGAWASQQSQVLKDRVQLEETCQELEIRWAGREIPRPENWGGYVLRPMHLEFWQGRESRLHDRFEYDLSKTGVWEIRRLAP